MRSPITFRDWLQIVGIVFLIGATFLLIRQLAPVDNYLDSIRNYIEIQNEYIY